jgi:flagellar hook-associated protein 1 FlgK
MAINSVVNLDKDLLAAGQVASNGAIAKGDNTNALALANLQYESKTIKRWDYERGVAPVSTNVNGTINEYLASFASSVGIASQSAQRSKEFQQTIYDKLTDMRNNISSVSLDEEMTDLIKYQHAYTAAAKLVTTADQMLETLVGMKSTT